MPVEEIPRIVLNDCLYVGELDQFFVNQPFVEEYNFRVRWHCDTCEKELACGIPMT